MIDLMEVMVNRPSGVHVTSIGGMPVCMLKPGWSLAEAVGESALLTKLNPRSKTRLELGTMCVDRGHLWAANWIMIGLTFVGYSHDVHMALAHDRRFWISWSEVDKSIWTATGSVKDWIHFLAWFDSPDFPASVRAAMVEARKTLSDLDPYFARSFHVTS